MKDLSEAGQHRIDAPVRREWLDQIVAETQYLAGRLMSADRDEAHALVDDYARSLPPCAGASERLQLRQILLDVAYKGGTTIHRRLHTESRRPCSFAPAALLDCFWSDDNADVLSHFSHWRSAFFLELNRVHPPTLGSSIGRLVKREFREPWQLATLARRFHATPLQIRRSFAREFGFSVREYQRLARLVEALARIRREKVEAVALLVGYKSKKNFYRAFVRLTGTTPGEFRKLSTEGASSVQSSARARLVRVGRRQSAADNPAPGSETIGDPLPSARTGTENN